MSLIRALWNVPLMTYWLIVHMYDWMIILYINRVSNNMYSMIMTIRTQLDPISFISKNSSNKEAPLVHALSEYELQQGARLGIDTHADTSCAGKHVRILEYVQGVRFSVAPFQGPSITNVSLANGVVAVDREDGQPGYILELNNFLDFSNSMEHSLLCPMQARLNGIRIDDIPTSLSPDSSQAIVLDNDNAIPIYYHGPIPFIHTRYPTDDDLDAYKWYQLTNNSTWLPYDLDLQVSSLNISNEYNTDSELFYNPNDLYHRVANSVIISGVNTQSKDDSITPEILSKRWRIPLPKARDTLKATTYSSIRTNEGQMSRRFRTDTYQRRYKRLGGDNARFYTDTLFSKVKSIGGDTCAQIYSNRIGFTKLYPMKTEADAHESLTTFIHEVGIPQELHSDGAKAITQGEYGKRIKKYEIRTTQTEPYSPWQNDAERANKIVKKLGRFLMQSSNTPIRLWSYAYMFAAAIRSLTASSKVGMQSRTPFERTMGYTPDISEYVSFTWYQWVWYWEPTDMQLQRLGRWCGVAETVGSGHTYYILNSKGNILARSSVSHLTNDELNETQQVRKDFDHNIKDLIGDYNDATLRQHMVDPTIPYKDFLAIPSDKASNQDDSMIDDELIEFMPSSNEHENHGIMHSDSGAYNESISKEVNDNLIGTPVLLPVAGKLLEGKIKSRKRSADGTELIGKENPNPLLDTRIYNVEFPDGGVSEYSTNVIIESLIENSNEHGETMGMIAGIVDHRKNDDAVPLTESVTDIGGKSHRIITTKGWELCVEWTDGTQNWMPLKDVKHADPMMTAEYAISKGIHREPAFAWWIPHTMRTRSRVISRLKATRISKGRRRFGVKVPSTIEEAEELDRINRNDVWKTAIEKELSKVRPAFELLEDGKSIPIGYKKINYHFVFDVKMDLTRKARLVAGGHLNPHVPKHTSYSSVVSRESVRICFLLAALNGQNVLSGDIGNAYLNAKPLEKCYVSVRDAYLFGPSAIGKNAIIVRALYGMKSSGNAWRLHLANILRQELNFRQCYADNDVWMRPSCDKNGNKVYDYICIYVDDILIISSTPKKYMDALGTFVELKAGSVGSPTTYLGTDTKLRKCSDEIETGYWLLGSNSYLKESLRIVKDILRESGMRVQGKGSQPYSSLSYRPELDVTPFCDPDQHNLFQALIGMLRWLIELGRIDVLLEATQLSSYLASPRIGHLMQALHIFHYLDMHNSSWMPMDPNKIDVEYKGSQDNSPDARRAVMKRLYPDAKEEIPDNMPEARGKSIQINLYVDADHAGNRVTRRSQTGILIFLNMALIGWHSRKQNTVEASTFGSE